MTLDAATATRRSPSHGKLGRADTVRTVGSGSGSHPSLRAWIAVLGRALLPWGLGFVVTVVVVVGVVGTETQVVHGPFPE